MKPSLLAALIVVGSCITSTAAAAESKPLWQIGKADKSNAEFALAPGEYSKFGNDGFFVVGESDAKRDWPYVHPGPVDGWAGSRPHTFTILFGLKNVPTDGDCRLDISLLDTQSRTPPKLRIEINGKAFEKQMPRGAGDRSVNGEPAAGKPFKSNTAFPASLLRSGDNEIRITTLTGSWVMYDCLSLAAPAGAELSPVQSRTLVEDVKGVRALIERDGKAFQPLAVSLRHYGRDAQANVRVQDGPAASVTLKSGLQTAELLVPAVTAETQKTVSIEIGGKVVATRAATLKPVRKLTVYILPHSHTDIGYTEIQTAIEKKQVNNLVEGIAHAKRTASYPEGSRFIWNVEVLWAADLYQRRLSEQQKADFLEAVKKGQVVLCGMYLNELTGLCRPEELIRLFRFATKLREQTGATIDSAMISDVPGYTWGLVPAMNQAGIKYFSTAPNYFDRIGTILREWENKPFYWIGPDGKSKVLVWIPFWGYAMSHRYGQMSAKLVDDFSDGLDQRGYPYDIAYVRWSGHGDNAIPDPAICEFVKDWNGKYAWPKFIISGPGEAFKALEQKYGEKLPLVRGDWTPYWEDGAGSSALETSKNRDSSDRLVQAEAMYAMLKPSAYPAAAFEDAWNNVLLYSEHTWGAYCSITQPEDQKTKEQWEIKQGYALAADKQSRDLLGQARELRDSTSPGTPGEVGRRPGEGPAQQARQTTDRLGSEPSPSPLPEYRERVNAIDVFNTTSWARSELVTLPAPQSKAGDRVTDDAGKVMPSQRLSTGELAFLAKDVPPLAARRFTISAGTPAIEGKAVAEGCTLDNGVVHVRVDEKTGGIVELTAGGINGNFADTSGGQALNDYLYLIGDDLKDVQRNGSVTVRIGEKGPLLATLVIESAAPGCKTLRREIWLTAGQDYVCLLNLVDKQRLAAKDYKAKDGKESLNFAFPFNVPGGQMLMDLPLGMMRPEADQMPSACKNWLTVGRWADVSNQDRGIIWVTLDAPLVQLGGLTARFLNSQYDPDSWMKSIEPTQKIYSWAMNNHWGTNYRAYQEGPTTFRFILRPHRAGANPAEASRFATAFSQPLLVLPARGEKPPATPLLRIEPVDVLVSGLKPSDDGKGLIVRLFNASGKAKSAKLQWGQRQPAGVYLSDTSEKRGEKAGAAVDVPSHGLVTLRVE